MRDKKRIPTTVQVRFWEEDGRMQIALRSMKRFALCFYCCFLFFFVGSFDYGSKLMRQHQLKLRFKLAQAELQIPKHRLDLLDPWLPQSFRPEKFCRIFQGLRFRNFGNIIQIFGSGLASDPEASSELQKQILFRGFCWFIKLKLASTEFQSSQGSGASMVRFNHI